MSDARIFSAWNRIMLTSLMIGALLATSSTSSRLVDLGSRGSTMSSSSWIVVERLVDAVRLVPVGAC